MKNRINISRNLRQELGGLPRAIVAAWLGALGIGAWLAAGCDEPTRQIPGDESTDEEKIDADAVAPDDTSFEGVDAEDISDDGSVDVEIIEVSPDDGDEEEDSCTPLPPDPAACEGEYLLRGEPLYEDEWAPLLGASRMQRTNDGWAWIRPAPDGSFRVVRADEHFTTLDTSIIVEGIPRMIDEVERSLAMAPAYMKDTDRWLFILASTDLPVEPYVMVYGIDGRPKSDIAVRIDPLPSTSAAINGDYFHVFTTTPEQWQSTDCHTIIRPTRIDSRDLSIAYGAELEIERGGSGGALAWRGCEWLSAYHDCATGQSGPFFLRDLYPDGTASEPREVIGLPVVDGSPLWGMKIFDRGPAVAMAPSSLTEVLYAPVDVETGQTIVSPVKIIDTIEDYPPGAYFGSGFTDREGELGYGMAYTETLEGGFMRLLFKRFTLAGEVVQQTTLIDLGGGCEPFMLEWLGDRYILGVSGSGFDELICTP